MPSSMRKAAVLAFVLLTVFFLFQTLSGGDSSSSSSSYPYSPASSNASPSYEQKRPYPPPRGASSSNRNDPAQRPLTDTSSFTLRDQLAYQFDYDQEGKFPAYIWQTWKYTPADGEFSDEFRAAEASWTEMHPGFVHQVLNDRDAFYLLKHLYASVPDVIEAYEALPLPVLKADFFRYLILLARGGIYSDIDTHALRTAADWVPPEVPRSSIGLVIGIEADPDRPDWKQWYSRRIQFCQWTMQAKAGHPVLREVVAAVTQDVLRMKRAGILKVGKMDKSTVELTGPAVWTDAVFNYLNDPKYFVIKPDTNITWESFTGIDTQRKAGDVLILPITSFSPGVGQMGAKDIDDPMAFVKHAFEGTWKPENERKITPAQSEEQTAAEAVAEAAAEQEKQASEP